MNPAAILGPEFGSIFAGIQTPQSPGGESGCPECGEPAENCVCVEFLEERE